jgi:hypothetical protein
VFLCLNTNTAGTNRKKNGKNKQTNKQTKTHAFSVSLGETGKQKQKQNRSHLIHKKKKKKKRILSIFTSKLLTRSLNESWKSNRISPILLVRETTTLRTFARKKVLSNGF